MGETARMISPDVESFVKDYSSKWEIYAEFAKRLEVLIRTLMGEAKIESHAIESRAKSVESVREKFQRPGKTYGDDLQEMTDLAGIRVILYYEEDVQKVCKLLEEEFVIGTPQSMDKGKLLADDQFGYLSVHYIVKLAKSRQRLSEWTNYKELKAEFQVRTVLQHAWASISHKLQYKRESQIPRKDRRRLVRLAGLLELADEQFSDLKKQLSATSRGIKREVTQKKYGLEVDLASVTEYVRASDVVSHIAKKFKDVGLQVNDQLGSAEQLTSVAVGLQLNTITRLNSILKKTVGELDDFLPVFIHENYGENESQWSVFPMAGDPDHWTTVALLQSVAKNLDRQKLRRLVSWGEGYLDTVISASQIAFRK